MVFSNLASTDYYTGQANCRNYNNSIPKEEQYIRNLETNSKNSIEFYTTVVYPWKQCKDYYFQNVNVLDGLINFL